jgi:hypothetical protein
MLTIIRLHYLFIISISLAQQNDNAYKRIHAQIFKDYNSDIRSAHNRSTPTYVSYDTMLYHIIDVVNILQENYKSQNILYAYRTKPKKRSLSHIGFSRFGFHFFDILTCKKVEIYFIILTFAFMLSIICKYQLCFCNFALNKLFFVLNKFLQI